jgi:hypothetical protein
MILAANKTYRKAILKLAETVDRRSIQDLAVELRVVWEVFHLKPRMKG